MYYCVPTNAILPETGMLLRITWQWCHVLNVDNRYLSNETYIYEGDLTVKHVNISVSSTFTKISNTWADLQCRAELYAESCHEMIFSKQRQCTSIYLLTTELISVHCATRQWIDKLEHICHLWPNHTKLSLTIELQPIKKSCSSNQTKLY